MLHQQSEGIEYTKEIFRCLILTMRSPTLSELALIADLPPETRDDQAILRGYIRRCGGFVVISEDNGGYGDDTVEWIDVAAKEHLLTYAVEKLTLSLNDVQHGIIALRCFDHVRRAFAAQSSEQSGVEPIPDEDVLRSTDDKSGPQGQDDESPDGDEEPPVDESLANRSLSIMTDPDRHDQASDAPAQLLDTDQDDGISDESSSAEPEAESEPALGYAVEYWVDHAIQAPADVVDEFDLSEEFWSEYSSTRASWWNERSKDTRYAGVDEITPMHLAALTGYPALLKRLLENERTEELQKADSWGYTPMAWACDRGDINLIDLLIKAGADINKAGSDEGPTALWAAAFGGHVDVVQYLLEHGAEVNQESKTRGTPLYVAASGSCMDVVRELLQHDAEVNLKGGWHVRALNVAAYYGYKDILQVILDHGADVDPDDDYRYGSALGAASRRGHEQIIRKLLLKGWNVNRKIKTYNGAIVAAAAYGHADAVRALLEHEVEGASQVQALEIASKNGRTEIVKHLLERTPNLPHQKAFHNAAIYGRDEILELLEKMGTNPEMLSQALYDASDQERESTVNLLLKYGADSDAEGKE